jgi:hypothetical protein
LTAQDGCALHKSQTIRPSLKTLVVHNTQALCLEAQLETRQRLRIHELAPAIINLKNERSQQVSGLHNLL